MAALRRDFYAGCTTMGRQRQFDLFTSGRSIGL